MSTQASATQGFTPAGRRVGGLLPAHCDRTRARSECLQDAISLHQSHPEVLSPGCWAPPPESEDLHHLFPGGAAPSRTRTGGTGSPAEWGWLERWTHGEQGPERALLSNRLHRWVEWAKDPSSTQTPRPLPAFLQLVSLNGVGSCSRECSLPPRTPWLREG